MATDRRAQPDDDLVRRYLTDIGRHPLLTKGDEVRLVQAIEAGRANRIELGSAQTVTAAL